MVERVSRFTIMAELPDAKATSVLDALTKALCTQPASMLHTLTYDRGTDMARHEELAKRLDIQVYFCDPHFKVGTTLDEQTVPSAANASNHIYECPLECDLNSCYDGNWFLFRAE